MNGDEKHSVKLPEETMEQLRSELSLTDEAVADMSEARLARTLAKLEIPDRPRLRLQQEATAMRGDEGTISGEGCSAAMAQMQQMQLMERAPEDVATESAGMPTGAPSRAFAPADAPTAGLLPGNTGWTPLGPGNIGGRTRAVVIDPTDTNRIYAAGAGGGVWRSTDAGQNWAPTDDLMANLAVVSLVMDPTDPNVLYAGTGEGFGNVDAIRGDGIFVTQDGAQTWTQLASTSNNANFRYVNSLAISSDGQTLLAGTNDPTPGSTSEGIFRSTDAGQTWNLRQTVSSGVGVVAFDPSDSSKAVAGGLEFGRAYFSTDGGDSWSQATGATGSGGRVQLCYAAADTSSVYASVEASPSSQIWRSTDGGQTFASRNATSGGNPANHLGGQGWYDNVIWAGDATNVNLVIVGGIDLWRSTDGGNTMSRISTWQSDQSAHADQHAIVSDPGYDGTSNRRVYFGNDGGVDRTDDVTTVGNNATQPFTNGWVALDNSYEVTQFYYGDGHIATNTIMGGAQDNGTLRYTPTQSRNGWNEVFGGDGGDVASDPSDPQTWYGEYVFLNIFRDRSGGANPNAADYISGQRWNGAAWVWKPAPFTIPDAQNSQALFIAPFELDPNNPQRILGGGVSLWRTNDARTANTSVSGPSWTSIKTPISTNPSRWTHSISAIAIAPSDSDRVAVGYVNGQVWVSGDATANSPQWQRVDTNGIGRGSSCLALTIDPDDADLIYASFGGFQAGNLWRTPDAGTTWNDISAGLPGVPIRDITLHPQRSTWIYLATQFGVFASEDNGATWSPTNEGPANVACRDFFWLGCRLVCVTHGRGMFEIDLPIVDAFPDPVLTFTGSENFTTGGNAFTRYRLSIVNRAAYPDSLFRDSPDLAPCGTNADASRTWVDIFNGDNNQRIYGFCALDSADDLDRLWFALPQGTVPPGSVYVILRDRRCPANYRSNSVSVGSLTTPTPSSCRITDVLLVGNQIEVTGTSTGCDRRARVDIEGPRGSGARIYRGAGMLDASGNFDVLHRDARLQTASGSFQVIIVNSDGTECCRSDWVTARRRRSVRLPW